MRGIEILEGRELLATFTVTSLGNSGTGTFREAIISANAQPGPDTIDFGVAGTIRIARNALPAITSPVTIDGTTAPGFLGSPVVTVNYQGTRGLRFLNGSNGSTLESLSLVRAGSAGVTLTASNITLQGNYIGILANGTTPAGNRGDGVQINASSSGDLIGKVDPVAPTYFNADNITIGSTTVPVSGWQGIRYASTSGQYLMTGTSGDNGLLYIGPISGVGGTGYSVNYPKAASTSVYGPDLEGSTLRLVGTYNTGTGTVNGFLYQGTTAELAQGSGIYETIAYPSAQYTYVHSTMGDLAVGNADGPEGDAPIGTGHAFIYDVSQNTFLPDVVYPGSTTTTAYGIWYNGGTSYTIVGGYSNVMSPSLTIGNAYMVDFDTATGQFTHWTSFAYPNGVAGQNFISHFQGVSSSGAGGFTLAADSLPSGSSGVVQGSWVTVPVNPDGSFGNAVWVNLNNPDYPATDSGSSLTSVDSVAGNAVVGFVSNNTGMFSYQATVTGFQLSNVISGNGGNGIGIYGARNNRIAMNYIGTGASGTIPLGNAQNGILVTKRAVGNFIGGEATGGNDPTSGWFVRPPQGNLISGNGGNGVLINNGATQTQLSGNFVGTSASGNSGLGNRLDGVAIVGASGNELLGCNINQSPFVFYNVLSGNGGNGLRITNSNNTTVQANFLGVGANNATVVGNRGDGLLVSGSSKNTQVGGVIPLGNVISGNNRNGIEVTNRASGFTSFNTFGGVYAFGGAAPNRRDGILITSSGGNNLIRTSIISGNGGNGIELAGNAQGVQVTDTAVGTNSDIQTAIPNGGNGIRIAGRAHKNAIGGFQPSIEPQVTVDASRGYGIQIVGSARNNVVFHTVIGANAGGTVPLPNLLGGIYVGKGTSATTIGGAAAAFQNQILYNFGSGLTIQSSARNTVSGNQILHNLKAGIAVVGGRNNQIGTAGGGNTVTGNGQDGVFVSGDVAGTVVQRNVINQNAGSGVTIGAARKLIVGGSATGAGNLITMNLSYGVYAYGVCTGTVVQGNLILVNAQGNVNLTNSHGITYIP